MARRPTGGENRAQRHFQHRQPLRSTIPLTGQEEALSILVSNSRHARQPTAVVMDRLFSISAVHRSIAGSRREADRI
jgi:hypothetical protein